MRDHVDDAPDEVIEDFWRRVKAGTTTDGPTSARSLWETLDPAREQGVLNAQGYEDGRLRPVLFGNRLLGYCYRSRDGAFSLLDTREAARLRLTTSSGSA